MDIELPRLAVWRNRMAMELSPSAAIEQLVTTLNAGRGSRKLTVAGRIVGPVPSLRPEFEAFEVEGEGTTLKVLLPAGEARELVRGQRLIVEGRMGLESSGDTLRPVLQGRRVQNASLDRLEPRSQPRLTLEDFFRSYGSGLVILGTERALHDIEDALERSGLDSGTLRREMLRMGSSADVLAAVRRYSKVAKGLLFVRRGGVEQEFAFWSDPAFIEEMMSHPLHYYLGLGHPDTQTGFDAYADEVFATPVAAGQALVMSQRAPILDETSVPESPVVPDFQPLDELSAAEIRVESEAAASSFHLSNGMIWIIALTSGAIILFFGLC